MDLILRAVANRQLSFLLSLKHFKQFLCYNYIVKLSQDVMIRIRDKN
jgi:hypothetical protein